MIDAVERDNRSDAMGAACPDPYADVHSPCGYPSGAQPDTYVNEEWFGITSPEQCADSIDALRPRSIYWVMRALWRGHEAVPQMDESAFPTCEELLTSRCVALGDGGSSLGGLFELNRREPVNGTLVCSGHGECTTDWRQCGLGSADAVATPCCSCDFGYAGAGCDQIDARLYPVLAVGCLLALLVALMVLNALAAALCRRRVGGGLAEPLLGSPS